MPNRNSSWAITCFFLFMLIDPPLGPHLTLLPSATLALGFLSDVDENRLTEIESLVDWAKTNAEVVRLDELGGNSRPGNSRCIVLRFDDVRDTAYRDSNVAFLEMMLQRKVKVTLGVVAGDFGADPLLSLVRKGVQEGYFEIAVHGWLHENFTALGEMERIELIRNAKNKLQILIPEATISTLIPPYEAVDVTVLEAAAENGLKFVTSDIAHGEPYDWDGVKFLSKTVDTAMPGPRPDDQWTQFDQASIVQEIERSFTTYGYAMAVIHPQQLTKPWTTNVLSIAMIGMAIAGAVVVISFVALTRRSCRRRPGIESVQRIGQRAAQAARDA